MKKRCLPKGTKIDHRDANSKLFVWLDRDGEKELSGLKRLCSEHNMAMGSFYYHWERDGFPDEVKIKVLDRYRSRKKRSEGWKVDGVSYPSLRSVATAMGRAESTVSDRFLELGRREATREELTKRKPKGIHAKAERAAREERTVLCPDGNRYTIYELHRSTGMSEYHLRRKAIEKGWEFDQEDMERPEEFVTKNAKVRPIDPVYMSPRYAHIELGDLCHLSGTRNTGAGKGEIPDEVWARSYGTRRAISGANIIF